MAMSSTRDLLNALRDERDDDIIGTQESLWFDAKGSAYILTNDADKWELAKDVSAMANASGGVLLIAAHTMREESWLEERVTEVVAVPEALVNAQQHLDVLKAWTFPPLAHRVRAASFERGAGKAVLALEVEQTPPEEQPVMVRTLAEGGRDVNAVAIARRYGTATEWVSSAQIWADIRNGRLAQQNLQLESGTDGLQSVEERVSSRLSTLEDLTESQAHMVLGFAAVPPSHTTPLSAFYTEGGVLGALRGLSKRGIRENGFGLGYGIDVDSVDQALVVVEPERRGVLVQRNRLCVAIAAGTDDFLGWATGRGFTPASLADRPVIRLNSLVLAEYTLEFARFVHDVLIADDSNAGWRLAVTARRLRTGEPTVFLPRTMNWLSSDGRRAVVDNPAIEFIDATADPEVDAFRLLAHFVEWFSLEPDAVPFTSDGRVSANAIRSFRPS